MHGERTVGGALRSIIASCVCADHLYAYEILLGCRTYGYFSVTSIEEMQKVLLQQSGECLSCKIMLLRSLLSEEGDYKYPQTLRIFKSRLCKKHEQEFEACIALIPHAIHWSDEAVLRYDCIEAGIFRTLLECPSCFEKAEKDREMLMPRQG